MWFDARAALAEIAGQPEKETFFPPGAVEIPWDEPTEPAPEMTKAELARDLYEERAAIREYCGGQSRPEAEGAAWPEARRAAGITWLDEWRRELDDPFNCDAWKNSPNERNLK